MTQSIVNGLTFGGQVQFDTSNLSALGTLETAELTPIIQGDFVYGLNAQTWRTAVTSGTGATVDTNASRLRIQSGTNAAGYAYIQTRRFARYRAGQGTLVRLTPVFAAGVANNVQIMGMFTVASNVPYDGYGFGYNGISFGIVHYNAGTPTWYAQTTDWNGDKCDGSAGSSFTYDPTKGTPVMIKYPYLGYGDIEFFIQVPTTGRWTPCHTIRYANANTAVQLTNPTLAFTGFTLNSGNTTNETFYCGSYGIFVSGMRSFIGDPKWAYDNNKASISTETCLINLKNCTTYNGVTNRGLIRLTSMSFSNGGNNTIATVRFKVGATIGGSPSYATINGTTADGGVTITSGNSIASVDVAGTTVSAGTYIWGAQTGPNGSVFLNLIPLEIFLAPGEILTISGTASGASLLAVALTWAEDI